MSVSSFFSVFHGEVAGPPPLAGGSTQFLSVNDPWTPSQENTWFKNPIWNETDVFHAQLTHLSDDEKDDNVECIMKIGKGGQLYSLELPLEGEILPPQHTTVSPWQDDCFITTIYDSAHMDPDVRVKQVGANWLQNGYYIKPDIDSIVEKPFYEPVVAEHFDEQERSYSLVNLRFHSQPSMHRSDVTMYTKFRHLGQGVTEITYYFYNFGEHSQDALTLPWGGIRTSKMPDHIKGQPPKPGSKQTSKFKNFQDKDIESYFVSKSGGWAGAAADATNSSSLAFALVHGRDPHFGKKNYNYIKTPITARVADTGRIRDFTVMASWLISYVHPGEGFFFRTYLVTGSLEHVSRTASKMVKYVDYGKTEYSIETAEKLPLFRTRLNGQRVWTATARKGSESKSMASSFAVPVKGSFPLLLMKEVASGTYLMTTDPYCVCGKKVVDNPFPVFHNKFERYSNRVVYRPYDGKTEWISILGYVLPLEKDRIGNGYEPLSSVLGKGTLFVPGEKMRADELMIWTGTPGHASSPSITIFHPTERAAPLARQGIEYDETLKGLIETDEKVKFSKVIGNPWLSVSANGTLTGTPGPMDGGRNTFSVKAEGLTSGKQDIATVTVDVESSVEVVTEQISPGTADWNFVKIHRPSGDDWADKSRTNSKITIPTDNPVAGGGGIEQLIDGAVHTKIKSPEGSVTFLGEQPNRILMDLGRTRFVFQLNTYSWHSTRWGQKYNLYFSRRPLAASSDIRSADLVAEGWQRLVDVNVAGKEKDVQLGVSIRNKWGEPLMRCRYILWDLVDSGTFFGEFDVFHVPIAPLELDGDIVATPDEPLPVRGKDVPRVDVDEELDVCDAGGGGDTFHSGEGNSLRVGEPTAEGLSDVSASLTIHGVASEGVPFIDSISKEVQRNPRAQSIKYTYKKVSGSAWLHVTSRGSICGTPGPLDGGENTFLVDLLEDETGKVKKVSLNIRVLPKVDVVAERNSPGLDDWSFLAIGSPTSKDFADAAQGYATINFATGFDEDSPGYDVGVLVDGMGQSGSDDLDHSITVASDQPHRIVIDLGSVQRVDQINTFSWHTDGPNQVYDLYYSTSAEAPNAASLIPSSQLPGEGWISVASVKTEYKENGESQIGVRVRSKDKNDVLMRARYILWDLKARDVYYGEFDVFVAIEDGPVVDLLLERSVFDWTFESLPSPSSSDYADASMDHASISISTENPTIGANVESLIDGLARLNATDMSSSVSFPDELPNRVVMDLGSLQALREIITYSLHGQDAGHPYDLYISAGLSAPPSSSNVDSGDLENRGWTKLASIMTEGVEQKEGYFQLAASIRSREGYDDFIVNARFLMWDFLESNSFYEEIDIWTAVPDSSITVAAELGVEGRKNWTFPTIPPPSDRDYADVAQGHATISVPTNNRLFGSGIESLLNGKAQRHKTDFTDGIYFREGKVGSSNRVLLDLGSLQPVLEVITFSSGTEKPKQQYDIYYSSGTPGSDVVPPAGASVSSADLILNGWTKLVAVRTAVEQEEGYKQLAVRSFNKDGHAMMSARYILFDFIDRKVYYQEVDVLTSSTNEDSVVETTVDLAPRDSTEWKFDRLPGPSSTDYADVSQGHAEISVPTNNQAFGAGLDTLINGDAQRIQTDFSDGVFFSDADPPNRIMIDLGNVQAVTGINTFSSHIEQPGQMYDVYYSPSVEAPEASSDVSSLELTEGGWIKLKSVRTSISPMGKGYFQLGVGLQHQDGDTMMDARYILFDFFDSYVFYGEIDVIASPVAVVADIGAPGSTNWSFPRLAGPSSNDFADYSNGEATIRVTTDNPVFPSSSSQLYSLLNGEGQTNSTDFSDGIFFSDSEPNRILIDLESEQDVLRINTYSSHVARPGQKYDLFYCDSLEAPPGSSSSVKSTQLQDLGWKKLASVRKTLPAEKGYIQMGVNIRNTTGDVLVKSRYLLWDFFDKFVFYGEFDIFTSQSDDILGRGLPDKSGKRPSASDPDERPRVAPKFSLNPLVAVSGKKRLMYEASMAEFVTYDDDDELTFVKISGPSWLIVDVSGELGGTPGESDVGMNTFLVRVSNSYGLNDVSVLNIFVSPIVEVEAERNSPGKRNWRFRSISGPSDEDYADASQGNIEISLSSNSEGITGTVGSLVDGTAPKSLTDEKKLFSFDEVPGRLVIDLGFPQGLSQVKTFSWGEGDGVNQNYDLYYCEELEDAPPISDAAISSDELHSHGWIRVASIETDFPEDEEGQIAVNVNMREEGTSWLTTRYILFDVKGEKTPYAEIDIDVEQTSDSAPSIVYRALALEGVEYSDVFNIFGSANKYEKTSGPKWVSVYEDGTIQGTPGPFDGGENIFDIQVSDQSGNAFIGRAFILVRSAMDMVAEQNTPGIPSWKFKTIPKPSKADFADLSKGNAKIKVTSNASPSSSKQAEYLLDGSGQRSSSEPSSSLVFEEGDASRIVLDLGSLQRIRQVNTFSWTDGDGSNQMYDLYGSDTNRAPKSTSEISSEELANEGWIPLAAVQTKFAIDADSQIGVSLTRRTDEDALYVRYLMLDIKDSRTRFGEIDVHTLNPPKFASNPVMADSAKEGKMYRSTLGGTATDLDDDDIVYTKIHGPSWLTIESDGTLSGVPGALDAGKNIFHVSASDSFGGADFAMLELVVEPNVKVLMERNSSPSKLFEFSSVSGPSAMDFADKSQSNVEISVTTDGKPLGRDVEVAVDGLIRDSKNGGDSSLNFVGPGPHRILLDLGSLQQVSRVNTFSSNEKGGNQYYVLYYTQSQGAPPSSSTVESSELASVGWIPLVVVKTNYPEDEENQIGVNLRGKKFPTLAAARHLLWDIRGDASYAEIDVVVE